MDEVSALDSAQQERFQSLRAEAWRQLIKTIASKVVEKVATDGSYKLPPVVMAQ